MWFCEGWLLLQLRKLNSDHFIFIQYMLLGLWSKLLVKILVFIIFMCSGYIFCRLCLGSRGERRGQLFPRREREAGTRSTPWVQSVLFKSLLLAIEHWGPGSSFGGCSLFPDDSTKHFWFFHRVTNRQKTNKQKDSNAGFVEVHAHHALTDTPFDSHKKRKVEGWVVMGWLVKILRIPIEMCAPECCLHLGNF